MKRGVVLDPQAVRLMRTRQLRLETGRAMTVAADGESIASTPVEFAVMSAALPVYVGAEKERS